MRRLDASRGTDTMVIPVARPRIAWAASPDRSKLAIGYSGADSSRLVVVDVGTGALTRLHAAGRAYSYSLAWSPDADRIAAGYFTERRVGRQTLPAAGDIAIATLDGRLTRAGCESSKVVYAWVAADTIVVGDGRELNPVDIGGCRSKASVRLQGKRDITFSPDGRQAVSGDSSGSLRLWNLSKATELANEWGMSANKTAQQAAMTAKEWASSARESAQYMGGQLGDLTRRYPITSILVAIGVGFCLGQACASDHAA